MDSTLIKQAIEIEGLKVIREYPSDENLMGYPQEKLNRNVSAFNEAGDLIWIIQEAPHGGEGQDKAYMFISIENGHLVAGNFIGVDYFVNPKDGTVAPKDKNARPW
jgi:hypothetical protein